MTAQRRKEVGKAIVSTLKSRIPVKRKNNNYNSAKLQVLKRILALSWNSSIEKLQKYIKKQIDKIEKVGL